MQDIGRLGEALVGRWLQLENYELLQQNWRCRWGEVDIIAQDKVSKTIAFVEVKTRSKNSWDEGGLLAVDFTKQEKIIKTASLFLAKYPQLAELPCRFDVALVSYKGFAQRRNSSVPLRLSATRGLERDAKKREAEIDFKDIVSLEIGQPLEIGRYQLTIRSYLQSAFELS